MGKYKYIGNNTYFIKNGDVINAEPTTWSIKKVNSEDRDIVKVIYFKNVGFDGKDVPINLESFIEIAKQQDND
jgi:hypothetical protein